MIITANVIMTNNLLPVITANSGIRIVTARMIEVIMAGMTITLIPGTKTNAIKITMTEADTMTAAADRTIIPDIKT